MNFEERRHLIAPGIARCIGDVRGEDRNRTNRRGPRSQLRGCEERAPVSLSHEEGQSHNKGASLLPLLSGVEARLPPDRDPGCQRHWFHQQLRRFSGTLFPLKDT